MKYIHGKEVRGRVTASGIIRIVIGAMLAVMFLFMLIMNIINYTYDSIALIIVYALTFGAGGALLLIFGIKSIKRSLKGVPMRDPHRDEPLDPENPFFTVDCPSCATRFDYQRSDLGFRAWYPNGYIKCPCCNSVIRHNAQTNVYRTLNQDFYQHPNV